MLTISWRETTGTQGEKPELIDEKSSPSTTYIRKDITREEIQSGSETVKVWKYKEAALTKEEYEEYKQLIAEIETPAMQQLREENKTLMAALADIYERLDTQENNQIAIMASLADIYETTESGV